MVCINTMTLQQLLTDDLWRKIYDYDYTMYPVNRASRELVNKERNRAATVISRFIKRNKIFDEMPIMFMADFHSAEEQTNRNAVGRERTETLGSASRLSLLPGVGQLRRRIDFRNALPRGMRSPRLRARSRHHEAVGTDVNVLTWDCIRHPDRRIAAHQWAGQTQPMRGRVGHRIGAKGRGHKLHLPHRARP